MSSFPPPGDGASTPPGGFGGPGGSGGSGDPAGPPGDDDGSRGGQHPQHPQGPPPSRADRPTVPLRPLNLGDMFDGTFRTIRRNLGATLGVAFLVNLAFLVIPVVGLAVLSALGQLGPLVPELDSGAGDPTGFTATSAVAGGLSFVSSLLAGVVVTGLVVQVIARAAIGERLTAGEAWRRTRPRLPALLGLTVLSALLPLLVLGGVGGLAVAVGLGIGTGAGVAVGVLLGLVAVVAVVWLWVRFFLLAPCVLVLERSGVVASLRRSRELSRGSSWRLLGTYLLISIVAYVVAGLVALPLTVLSLVVLAVMSDQTLGTVLVLTLDNFGTVVSGAIATPFVGAVVALQYLDVRMRREGLDVRLQQQAARARAGDAAGSGD